MKKEEMERSNFNLVRANYGTSNSNNLLGSFKPLLLYVLLFTFVINFTSAAPINDTFHINLQTTYSNGSIETGTFVFAFNITESSDASCVAPVVYNYSTSATTDSRGRVSIYLPAAGNQGNLSQLNFDRQYYICYYRDGSLKDVSQLGRVPYSFRATQVNLSEITVNSNLNLSSFNISQANGGFFSFLGSLTNRITSLFVQSVNVSGTLSGTNATFNGGWEVGGVSITGGDIYAQTGYFYNITSLNVTQQNLTINNALRVFGNAQLDQNLTVDTNTLFVNSNTNNVGIGTTSPGSKLHVLGGAGTNYTGRFENSNTNRGVAIGVDSTESAASIQGYAPSLGPTGAGQTLSINPLGGSVAIGTTSPTAGYKLDVNGTSDFTGLRVATGGAGIFTVDNDGSNHVRLIMRNNTAGVTVNITSFGSSYLTGGSFGIGTTNPEATLQVKATNTTGSIRIGGGNGASNSRVYINSAGNSSYIDSYGDDTYQKLAIYANPLVLNALGSGNVGINTSTPQNTLNVFGDINTTGNLSFYDEIKPDGDTCAAGQILKKTAANNWDCAADDSTAGGTITGLGTVGRVPLWNNTGSINNSNIAQGGSGFIGIGTTTPENFGGLSFNPVVDIEGSIPTLNLKSNGTDGAAINLGNVTERVGSIGADITGRGLTFATAGTPGSNSTTERMRITSGGNIGIGTTAPGRNLEVNGTTGIVFTNSDDTDAVAILAPDTDEDATLFLYNTTGANNVKFTGSGDSFVKGGNLGLGTTSPGTQLTLGPAGQTISVATPSDNSYLALSGSDSLNLSLGAAIILSGVSRTSNEGQLELFAGDNSTHGKISFKTGSSGTERMSILHGGNVGIGNTTPTRNLHLNGSAATYFSITAPSTNVAAILFGNQTIDSIGRIQYDNSNGRMTFLTASNDRLTISNAGNIGINTTTPSYQLEILGGGAATDGLFINTTGYGSVPNPGNITNAIIMNPRGLAIMTDSELINSSYQPSFGLTIVAGRATPAAAFKNTVGPAIVVEKGNVGIGNSNPAYPLVVNSSGTGTSIASNIVARLQSQGSGRDATLQFSDGVTYANFISMANGSFTFLTSNPGPVNALYLNASGQVGIGTTSPNLSNGTGININGSVDSITGPAVIRLSEVSSGLGHFEIRSTKTVSSSGNRLDIGEGTSTFLTVRSDDDAGTTTTRGFVGIGTTSPGKLLSLNSTAATRISFNRTSSHKEWMMGTDTSPAGFYLLHDETAAATRIFVTDAGLVGINTTSPQNTLNVFGDINTTGNLTFYDEIKPDGDTCAAGQILKKTAANNWDCAADDSTAGGTITGLGTVGRVPLWNGTSALNNSNIYQGTGGGIGINTTTNETQSPLTVKAHDSTALSIETLGRANDNSSLVIFYDANRVEQMVKLEAIGTGGGQFRIHTNQGERMRIDESGNVGIGTTSPNGKLHVNSTQNASNILVVNASSSSGGVAQFGVGIYDTYTELQSYGAGNSPGYLALNPQGNNVGIGTSRPSTKLHVLGSDTIPQYVATSDATESGIRFLTGTTVSRGYLGFSPTGFRILNGSLNTELFTILQTGNVGIGTTAPAAFLNVFGTSAKTDTGAFHTTITDSTTAGVGVGGGITLGGYKTGTSSLEYFAGIDSYKEVVTAGNAAGALRFHTQPSDGSGLNEWMRITSSGNVGIGNTSPIHPLTVKAGTNIGISLINDLSTSNLVRIIPAGSGVAERNQSVLQMYSNGAITTQLYSAGDSYFNGGNVGIGTASPAHKLHVVSSEGLTVNATDYRNTSITGVFGRNGAMVLDDSFFANDFTSVGVLGATSNDGSPTGLAGFGLGYGTRQAIGATLGAENAGGGNAYGLYIEKVKAPSGTPYSIYSTTTAVSYFAGNVGIVTINPPDALSVIGNVNASGCFELANGTVVGGSCVSDLSTKENIEEYTADMGKLLALSPKQFEFKGEVKTNADGSSKKVFTHMGKNGEKLEMEMPQGVQTGFIADEVEQFYPEWVSEDENGLKRVTYGMNWIFELWQQNQEQQKEIGTLKEELCKKDNTYSWC